jgi:hypothetical protein
VLLAAISEGFDTMLKLRQIQELEDWLGTVDLQGGELGQPMYLDQDLKDISKDVVSLSRQPSNLEGIAKVVDEQTSKAIQKMSDGAKNIQTEADSVWKTFSAFATMGSIQIKDIKGSDDAEIKAQFAKQHGEYTTYMHALTKQSIMFSEIAYNFAGTAKILELQIKLSKKEDLFSKKVTPGIIQNLIKQQKKFIKDVDKIRAKNEVTMDLVQKFGRTDFIDLGKVIDNETYGQKLFYPDIDMIDPLYFEVAAAYLDYVHEVYGLEAQAREIDTTITQMNAEVKDSNLIEVYNDIELLKKAKAYASDSRPADLLRGSRDLVGRGAGAVRDTKTAQVTSDLFGKAIGATAGNLYGKTKGPAGNLASKTKGLAARNISKLLKKFIADIEDTNATLATAYRKISAEAINANDDYSEPEEVKSRSGSGNIQQANRALAKALRDSF